MTRFARKVDANQPDIVKAFRDLGCRVLHLHMVGAGCPDIAVAKQEITALVEIKDGKGKMTPDELEFHKDWPGLLFIVRTEDDVARVVSVMESEKELRGIGLRRRFGGQMA